MSERSDNNATSSIFGQAAIVGAERSLCARRLGRTFDNKAGGSAMIGWLRNLEEFGSNRDVRELPTPSRGVH